MILSRAPRATEVYHSHAIAAAIISTLGQYPNTDGCNNIFCYTCRLIPSLLRGQTVSTLSPPQPAMADYSNYPSYGSPDKGRVMDQVRSQIAVASAQELIQVGGAGLIQGCSDCEGGCSPPNHVLCIGIHNIKSDS